MRTIIEHLENSRDSDSIDFLRLLTKVNHDVAEFTSAVPDHADEECKKYDGKKQMPVISSRLTRRLVFRRGTSFE